MYSQRTSKVNYYISIIRPQLHIKDFKIRGRETEPEKLKAIRNGLLSLHTLELMATTIYRFQITKENSKLNRQLITAMCNEMAHYQDFQVKLYEYGWTPFIFRWLYWIVGFTLGLSSRLIGKKVILKLGIWVETKAVNHYTELLNTIDWDEDCRNVIEKDQADEKGHINNWRNLLQTIK